MPAPVDVLVVPWDSGFPDRRTGAGPARLMDAGVLAGLATPPAITTFTAEPGFRGEVASAFEIQRWLALRVSGSRGRGALPLVLAGNCMAAVGVFAGLRSRSRRVPAVCWFDAHADFNTPETSESGFLDGMALATLTGRCWTALTRSVPHFRPAPDDAVVMIGTRSIDGPERKLLLASGTSWPKTPAENHLAEGQLDALRERFGEVYLHIDLDVLDTSEGRANSYACGAGLSRTQLTNLVRRIGENFHIGAAAITAYDPSCDPEGRIPPIVRELVELTAGSVH